MNSQTIALISHASKVVLKILHARLQHYVNQKLPDVQVRFRKGRGTRDQIANICWNVEKARKFQKSIYFCFINYAEAFAWIMTNRGELLERREHQTLSPASWEACMQGKKQQVEPCMEQLTGSRLRKEYDKAVYCHPVYLTYMQSISCKMLGWMKHKLDSRLQGELSTNSDMQKTTSLWQKVKWN